jgi:PAT family beta-lactamase induction signal transducer AmpG
MHQIAPGKYPMAHFTFAMLVVSLALGLGQAMSGFLADQLGYQSFFLVVLMASILGVIAAWKAPFSDPPPDVAEDMGP